MSTYFLLVSCTCLLVDLSIISEEGRAMGYIDGFRYILLRTVNIVHAFERPRCIAEVRSGSEVRLDPLTRDPIAGYPRLHAGLSKPRHRSCGCHMLFTFHRFLHIYVTPMPLYFYYPLRIVSIERLSRVVGYDRSYDVIATKAISFIPSIPASSSGILPCRKLSI